MTKTVYECSVNLLEKLNFCTYAMRFVEEAWWNKINRCTSLEVIRNPVFSETQREMDSIKRSLIFHLIH